MRRNDRDVSSPDEIERILQGCAIGRLGLTDGDAPYVVPMHFAYRRDGERFTVYFHGANAGHRTDLIGEGAPAGFEVDRLLGLSPTNDPCNTTAYYESVIGRGWVEVCRDPAEKRQALTLFTQRFTPHLDSDFDAKPVDFVAVLRLRLDTVTAKRNAPPPDVPTGA
ncbi:MAG: pyridoxamine 5'-phosphate oxidase family protein [Bifidobacteriaceae bacterium]|jgi:nitroimidazol reductase NimA-like FMN-containing flavoprotein (pyridoxamine 5'-phosphate oxidase superfamily)|nr:pyridoxamine 5'-phosphate oxidase family protein [Bifidobacteriaceae bacterium]